MIEAKSLGPLHAATRDLHHAVEQTALGRAMADGSVSEQDWADWLLALFIIHSFVDKKAPPVLRRTVQVRRDIEFMQERGVWSTVTSAPWKFTQGLQDDNDFEGAIYVLAGAHVMGGALIRKRIGDRLPSEHLFFDEDARRGAVAEVRLFRDRPELAQGARNCFQALLDTAREIEAGGLL
jgi:hypothetical protein